MSNKSNNWKTGALGEKIAQLFLENKGYQIIETNYRVSRYCEIDLIAKHKNNIYVFIEVKTRIMYKNELSYTGYDAIDSPKIQKLNLGIKSYLNSHNLTNTAPAQLDLVIIWLNPDNLNLLNAAIIQPELSKTSLIQNISKTAQINHLENISLDLF